ncbi:MAG: AMP-binding protein [Desulfatirhabdiaceae bacterium]
MRQITLYDVFQRNAEIFGNRISLVCNQQSYSNQDVLRQVNALASGLTVNGIQKGDRIAVLAHNCHRFFLLFGAAAATGAIVVPINWRLSLEEIQHILSDCSPKMLCFDSHHASLVEKLVAGGYPGMLLGFHPNTGMTIDSLMDAAGPLTMAAVHTDDPFCIIYTAAVAGKARGAVLSHGNMVYGNLQTIATMGLNKQDAYLNMLPIFHITGMNLSLSVMHAGGKNVIMDRFDAHKTLENIDSESISVIGSFPPILSSLISEMEAGDFRLTSLRHVLGLDNPDTIKTFESKTHAIFWTLYGQTETSGMATLSPASERPGSAGKQGLLIRMRLVDESENPVPTGTPGEIVVQGPLVFQGFWNQDEANRMTFRKSWHHTGDLGKMDADGYLWFAGRKPEKELIKPGGENVYPAEVEQAILEHPSVDSVSVIGVPDPKFGEGVKAVCVLKPNEVISAEDIIEFVASRIARYKKPRYVQLVKSLPRTSTGAIDRVQVKALYGGS